MCRSDEDACGALAVVHDGGRLVFNRYRASETVRHLGIYRLGQSADPQPQVQLVWRLVDKDSAAFAAPGTPPASLVVVGLRPPPRGDDPAGVPDFPNCTAAYNLFEPAVQRVVALIQHDREGQFGL